MDNSEAGKILRSKGLRVTPQRIAIFQAVIRSGNHPSPEMIKDHINKEHPHISVGTIYKVLDSFVDSGLLKKVKTESGVMRFDPLIKKHHHIYCTKTDKIIDYEDNELDNIISDYFNRKGIKDFEIQDFNVQITGNFTKNNEHGK